MSLSLPAAAVAVGSEAVSCRSSQTQFLLPASNQVVALAVDPGSASHAVLLVEEHGRDLEWRYVQDEAFRAIAVRPPRLGLLAIPVGGRSRIELRSVGLNRRPAPVRARLLCQPDQAQAELPACLAAAEHGHSSLTALRRYLATQSWSCRGWLMHGAAAAAVARGDSVSAVRLYRAAADLWARASDPARQAAAELGLAERLGEQGNSIDAISIAERSASGSRQAGIDYFAVRAQAERCMQLDYVGRNAEASACAATLPAAYRDLGEVSEAANAWGNLASMAIRDGHYRSAARHLEQAFAIETAGVSAMVSGRLHLQQAKLDLALGQVPAAFSDLERAATAMQRAGDRRWQANVQAEAARLYHQLSAQEEAIVLLEQARQGFVVTQMLPRLAAVRELEARVELARGREQAARAAAIEAAQRYGELAMPERQLEAWLLAALAGGGADVWDRIDAYRASHPAPAPRLAIDIELAQATRALRTRAVTQELPRRLAELAATAGSMEQLLRIRRLQVLALLAVGDAESAHATATAAIDRALTLAQSARVPSLRHLLVRQARVLGSVWVDAVLALPAQQRPALPVLRAQLERLQGAALLMPRSDDIRSARSELDRNLALALLADESSDPQRLFAAQQSLLAHFARSGERASLPAVTATVATASHPVPADVLRLSLGLGETRAFALIARGDSLQLHEIGAAAAIRDSAARLIALAQRREASVAELSVAASELSRLLLPAGLGPPPRQLWVESDETLAAVPFALLPWPGENWPMVEATAISHRLGADGPPPTVRAGVDVLVAAQVSGETDSALPRLYGAEREPQLLAAALPGVPVRTYSAAGADRQRLETILAQPGAWLHVAAHGVSRSGIQGLAGLWLTPRDGGTTPDFVSWLSLADRPLAASLIVLNACQLADGGAAVAASTSFAQALAAAGVADVVAARWQISDSASAVWVPAFYRALADPATVQPALALRAAQLALRRSRAFRHPFHWAGLSHIRGAEAASAGAEACRSSEHATCAAGSDLR